MFQFAKRVPSEARVGKHVSVTSFDGAIRGESHSFDESYAISPHSYKIGSASECKLQGYNFFSEKRFILETMYSRDNDNMNIQGCLLFLKMNIISHTRSRFGLVYFLSWRYIK